MTTLETSKKNLNDKIHSFRQINLGIIRGLGSINGIVEMTVIKKALELANLHAWNAQIVNETYHDLPRIEFPCSKDFTEKLNEVLRDDVQLSVRIIEGIAEIVAVLPVFFEMLDNMEEELYENHEDNFNSHFKAELQKLTSITDSLKKTYDCLSEATLWCSLYLERKFTIKLSLN